MTPLLMAIQLILMLKVNRGIMNKKYFVIITRFNLHKCMFRSYSRQQKQEWFIKKRLGEYMFETLISF